MANPTLFHSAPPGAHSAPTTTKNDAGGLAYALSREAALAQLALTGTFNDTFYASATAQYDRVKALAFTVAPEYLAKLAVYSRENGQMKDMPAFLLAVLSIRDPLLFRKIFNRVITNGKMLRNFVQFMRSGTVGRKSLGSGPKKAIQQWLNKQSMYKLLQASIGNSPSLADVVKMVHPKGDAEHDAFYRWLIKGEGAPLPQIADYEAFVALLNARAVEKAATKTAPGQIPGAEPIEALSPTEETLLYTPLPQVPMEMLTALQLPKAKWLELAHQMTWSQLRQSLNTLARHGLFDDAIVTEQLAARLANQALVAKARAFPYQIMTTLLNTEGLPHAIAHGLHRALELSLDNVPTINTTLLLGVDVSASMSSAITGQRKGATSKTRNVDVAALVASAFVRSTEKVAVLPFDTRAFDGAKIGLSKTSSIADNTRVLAGIQGGGTNVAIPLAVLNSNPDYFPMAEDGVILLLSDNESWSNTHRYNSEGRTQMLMEWRRFRQSHPKAKLICVDISPNTTVQVPDEPGVINIGGFGDNVFTMIADFVNNDRSAKSLADHVQAVELI